MRGALTAGGIITRAPRTLVGAAAITFAAGLFGCTVENGPTSPAQLLTAAGFRVQEGHVSVFRVEDCELLERCFGNNVAAPYLLFNLPGFPDDEASVPPPSLGPIPGVPENMAPAYFLESNEVVWIEGEHPTSASYFGFTPYLFQRSDVLGERVPVFASLSDTVNDVSIAASPDASFSILIGSDLDAMQSAHEAIVAGGGGSKSFINELILPRDKIRHGRGADDDTLLILGRTAFGGEDPRRASYLEDVPLRVYRITPKNTGQARVVPARAPRGDGTSEDGLNDALDTLEAAIIANLGGVPHSKITMTSAAIISTLINPDACLEDVTECLGDNSDTTYAAGPLDVIQGAGELKLGADDRIIIYGVNHRAAGKAIYSNVSVYSDERRIGVAAITDKEMEGTTAWLDSPTAEMKDLFVYEVRRDCGSVENCLALPEDFPGVPLNEDLFFIFRAYINPGLAVSAAPEELLTERVIFVPGGG